LFGTTQPQLVRRHTASVFGVALYLLFGWITNRKIHFNMNISLSVFRAIQRGFCISQSQVVKEPPSLAESETKASLPHRSCEKACSSFVLQTPCCLHERCKPARTAAKMPSIDVFPHIKVTVTIC